jgi:hypothetical protein
MKFGQSKNYNKVGQSNDCVKFSNKNNVGVDVGDNTSKSPKTVDLQRRRREWSSNNLEVYK